MQLSAWVACGNTGTPFKIEYFFVKKKGKTGRTGYSSPRLTKVYYCMWVEKLIKEYVREGRW
jgi:hypothetical protein